MKQFEPLLKTLENRFKKHMYRHPNLSWEDVFSKLDRNPDKLEILDRMEQSGGEPDIVMLTENSQTLTFYDCASESPKGRRSFCYDRQALESRKKFPPENNVLDVAKDLGIELLTENEYRNLQQFESFDTKTSSWIKTPENIRKLGGALFCDNRYDHVFTYHNGADSYYAARGFRGKLDL